MERAPLRSGKAARTCILGRCLLLGLALFLASPAWAEDCSTALADSALAGTMLEDLAPGSSILFWGDSVTARGGESNYAQILVRILNTVFARYCDDDSTTPSPALVALMRGRSQRRSYREANTLRATVANLTPDWVLLQDAGETLPLSPSSGDGFADDVRASIDAVFGPTSGSPAAPIVQALFLLKAPPLDEPGRDPFICKDYAAACNWTAHNAVLDEAAQEQEQEQESRRVVTVAADADACTAMAVADVEFAGDGVHPEKIGYLVEALSILRAMGVEPHVVPEAVLVAQGFTEEEVASVRGALIGPAASPAHPRCTMDPSCEPLYLADPEESESALDCIAWCEARAPGSCRPAFRGIGSCCLATGHCVDGLDVGDCPSLGDSYGYYAPVGACCDAKRGCVPETGETACTTTGGRYRGDGTRCVEDCCEPGASCPACGNGVTETGEHCDDGARSDGDCCAWSCTHQIDGATCADDTWCNGSDSCIAGNCSAHAGDPCSGSAPCAGECNETDDSCDLEAGSACTDAATCHSAVCATSGACTCDGDGHCSIGELCPLCAGVRHDCADPGKARIAMRNLSGGRLRSLSFRSAASDVVPENLGDPTSADGGGLAVCVYVHATGASPTVGDLLWQAALPAGELCSNAEPCWSTTASEVSYRRAERESSLHARLQAAGGSRRARLGVEARGDGLGLPEIFGIGVGQRITVQLLTQIPDGDSTRCWQETFDEGVLESTTETFRARTSR